MNINKQLIERIVIDLVALSESFKENTLLEDVTTQEQLKALLAIAEETHLTNAAVVLRSMIS